MKRKLILLVFPLIAAVMAALTVLAAEEAPQSLPQSDNTVNAASVGKGSKRLALEAANTQVENGETPDQTVYFSDETKYRTLKDGYYTITLSEVGMCFNVDTDGANNDYEGIAVTVWQNTDDITQRFRAVMNDDGTFTLYAACSHGGYNRAVGYDPIRDKVGLYSAASPYAATFFIKDAKDTGDKYIVLSTDETKYLSAPINGIDGTAVILSEENGEELVSKWTFETWGSSAQDGVGEKAMYPADELLVTQGPFDIYSHMGQNATDIQTYKGDSIFAPFTSKVVAINKASGNVVWLQSLSKVLYADGSLDYMTVLFMHDNDISDIYLDQIILQGEDFYEMGTAGYAEGSHVHISCFRGEYSPSMKIANNGDDQVNIWDAFFLPEDISVADDYGFAWVYDGN